VVQLVDPKHEWASEIGRMVIAFGSIEHVTMMCLRQLPRDPIYSATSHLNLVPRLDLLMAVLNGSSDPDAAHLAQLFGEARRLAEDRNLILHNPLMLDVYEDNEGNYELQHAIQSVRRAEKQLSLVDIVGIRETAERLATDLYVVASPMLEQRYKERNANGNATA
jgi:hypothetical protein